MRKLLSIPLHAENFEVDTKYGKVKVIPVSTMLEIYPANEVQEWLYGYYYMHLIGSRPLNSLGICVGNGVRGLYDLWGRKILIIYRVDME